jgi:hypothetical protein
MQNRELISKHRRTPCDLEDCLTNVTASVTLDFQLAIREAWHHKQAEEFEQEDIIYVFQLMSDRGLLRGREDVIAASSQVVDNRKIDQVKQRSEEGGTHGVAQEQGVTDSLTVERLIAVVRSS